MKQETLSQEYQGNMITFDATAANLMVNATEMAKIYDKEIKDFMRNDNTKSFIDACLKTENSPFLNVQTEEDLYTSKQKTGTFMHRVLALKFAAWLDHNFELWVYRTIESIIAGEVKQKNDEVLLHERKARVIAETRTKLLEAEALLRKGKAESKRHNDTLKQLYERSLQDFALFDTGGYAIAAQNDDNQ